MHILNFDDFCTDWKPWLSAFNRYNNHQIRHLHQKLWRFWISTKNHLESGGQLFWKRPTPFGGGGGSKNRISQKFSDLRLHFELIITFDADVQFWWFLYRLKALSLSFHLVQKSSKFDICVKRYSNFEKSPRIQWPAFLKKPASPPLWGGGEAGFFKKANYH